MNADPRQAPRLAGAGRARQTLIEERNWPRINANEEGNFMCAEQRESATRATVEAHGSERRGQPARRLQSATAGEGKKMADVFD